MFKSEEIGDLIVRGQANARESRGRGCMVTVNIGQIDLCEVWQKIGERIESFPGRVVVGLFLCPLKPLESTGKRGEDRDEDVDAIPAHHTPLNAQFPKVLKRSEVGKCSLKDARNHQWG